MNFIITILGMVLKAVVAIALVALIGLALIVGVAFAEAKSQVTCQANGLAVNDSGIRVQQVCTDGTGAQWTEYRK
jgi:hypothetical protein